MELMSKKFIRAVKEVFESSRDAVATIHYKSKHTLVQELKGRKDVFVYEIDASNRDKVLGEMLQKLHS